MSGHERDRRHGPRRPRAGDHSLVRYGQLIVQRRPPGIWQPHPSLSVGLILMLLWLTLVVRLGSTDDHRQQEHRQDCVDINSARDSLLRRSFHAAGQPAARLIRAGLLIAWLQLNVPGSRPVLARGWHGTCPSSRTTGASPLAVYRSSPMHMWTPGQDSRSTRGLLYLAAVRDHQHQQEYCRGRVDIGSASLTATGRTNDKLGIPVSILECL